MQIYLAGPSLGVMRRQCGKPQASSMFGDYSSGGNVEVIIDRLILVGNEHQLPMGMPANSKTNSIWLVCGSTINAHNNRVDDCMVFVHVGRDGKCRLAIMISFNRNAIHLTASVESLLPIFAAIASNQIATHT